MQICNDQPCTLLMQKNSLAKIEIIMGVKRAELQASAWMTVITALTWQTFLIASLSMHAFITSICFEYKQCFEFAIWNVYLEAETHACGCVCVCVREAH